MTKKAIGITGLGILIGGIVGYFYYYFVAVPQEPAQ